MKLARWFSVSLFFAAWLVLTSGNTSLWLLGLAAAFLAGMVSANALPAERGNIVWSRLPVFLAFFLIKSLKGGLRVAFLALSPQVKLQPSVVAVPSRLKNESVQKLGLSLMTLMPGTIGVSTDGRVLQVHQLEDHGDTASEVAALEQQIIALMPNAERDA